LAQLITLAALGQACGTQPCFRHSDCASSEVCSMGSCVPAPLDVPMTPIDGSTSDATNETPAPPPDTGTQPTPDVSDAGRPSLDADAGEAPTDASDASDANDASDAPSERAADGSLE